MRLNHGFVLTLAFCAVAACDPARTEAPAAPEVSVSAPDDGQAVACMAYLSLQGSAVAAGTAQGDVAALDAAQAVWRAEAAKSYSQDELAQFFASSVAVFDDTPAEELAAEAATCLSTAPAP